MSEITKAVEYMKNIAADPKHGYSQLSRWGNPNTVSDYDCSSLVISAYEAAGIKVKTAGATYTGNMYNAFVKCGFNDVTKDVNLTTGKGLIAGDVLLNHQCHTAMMIDSKHLAQASIDEKGGIMGGKPGDQTGQEINTRGYYNYPWNVVLRYPEVKELPVLDKTGCPGPYLGGKFPYIAAEVNKRLAAADKKILEKKGYVKGDSTIGVYSFKLHLIRAKKLGIVKQGVKADKKFGAGTEKAVNELLKKWGYAQSGIAGEKFITKLNEEIDKKMK